MSRALTRLQKVLALEQKQGYRNKAVIGGMDSFVERWEEDARAGGVAARQVEAIVRLLRSYAELQDNAQRSRAVEDLLALATRPEEVLAAMEPAAPEPAAVRAKAPPNQEPQRKRKAPSRPDPGPPGARRRARTRAESIGLDAPVTRLPGVGPKNAERYARLGIKAVGDFLWYFPRRYDDYSTLRTIDRLEVGDETTVMANLWEVKKRRTRSGREMVQGVIADGTGTMEAIWWNPYVVKRLRVGRALVLSGKVDLFMGRRILSNPEFEYLDQELVHTGRLVPIYPLTEGVSARQLRQLTKKVVDTWAPQAPDPLPQATLRRTGLLPLAPALQHIHFPDDWEKLEQARQRLAFDEFFYIQLGVQRQRHQARQQRGRPLPIEPELAQHFLGVLPFQLTGAQQRVLNEIANDMAKDAPMSRLVQGDVGSGKTVVAAGAMWIAMVNDAQSVLLAPTQILAEQHYRGLSRLYENLQRPDGRGVRVALLTGNVGGQERAETLAGMAEGTIDIVVGTHALIQEGVRFHKLGLAVVDEQHRFGVAQRATLRAKGYNPHVLVMSATPIPRTLALTVWGDLDLSIVDEMPPGRQTIKTRWVLPRERERAYAFLRRQVEHGRQGFIIFPLVEESEASESKAAVAEHARLQKEVFPDLRLGLLHGRMKGNEKEEVMSCFAAGELDVLVATSVVEVGIDVPNATVMLIEGAERFGLSQLHQFRGRVGRGEHPSYCVLISSASTAEAQQRLQTMEETTDGFVLAEKDLELRGPGDFFGTRQSGLPELRLARLSDLKTIELARSEAQHLFERDPELQAPEHRLLAEQVARFWRGHGDIS